MEKIYMLILSFSAALLSVILSVASIVSRKKRKEWHRENVVCLPFYMAVLGCLGSVGLSVPMIACAMDGEWLFLVFVTVVVVCDGLMAAYLNCVVRYDDEGFRAGNLLGISRWYSYGQIKGIREGKDLKIYLPGRRVLIDEIHEGREAFITTLERGYRKATGKRLPSKPRKWDPMNVQWETPGWGLAGGLLWAACF
jgi:hypothetical protein